MSTIAPRRTTRTVVVGTLALGSDFPVRVQTMTKGDTADVEATGDEIVRLEAAGTELIRVAVPSMRQARVLGAIRERISVPLVADIHFSAPLALEAIAQGVDKVRINPGNIGRKEDVERVVRAAHDKGVAIRVGVNAGSIRERKGMTVEESDEDIVDLCVKEALRHVEILEGLGFQDTVLSIKAPRVEETVEANRRLAAACDYPIHLGVTHAGGLLPATVKSSAAFALLLAEGIGDTIRVSITGENRDEVKVGHLLLNSLGLRTPGFEVYGCPSCGRAEVDLIGLHAAVEDATRDLSHPCRVAVMGCVVNGPGEAADADVSISAGRGFGFIYRGARLIRKVPEKDLVRELRAEIDAWIADRKGETA